MLTNYEAITSFIVRTWRKNDVPFALDRLSSLTSYALPSGNCKKYRLILGEGSLRIVSD